MVVSILILVHKLVEHNLYRALFRVRNGLHCESLASVHKNVVILVEIAIFNLQRLSELVESLWKLASNLILNHLERISVASLVLSLLEIFDTLALEKMIQWHGFRLFAFKWVLVGP